MGRYQGQHRGRKRPKHSLSFIELTRECDQRHSHKFNTIPPVTLNICKKYMCGGEGGCRVVSPTIYCRTFTLCMGPDSESIKLLDCPKTKSSTLPVSFSLGAVRKTNSCHKVLSEILLRRRDFALPSTSLLCSWTGNKTSKLEMK